MNAPSCSISQAACAAIASPDAYEPVNIDNSDEEVTYISAMAGYANPTNEMLKEAEKVFGKNAMVATIISIGSGNVYLPQNQHESPSIRLDDTLKRVILDTERVHNDLQGRFQDLGIYFRFNAESIAPMHSSIGKLTRVRTMTYLEEAITSQRMDGAINSIQERNGVKPLKEISTKLPFRIIDETLLILQIRFPP
jgi:hypothetical protein